MCFFFFQAEDGIRDADVTGVQTCALPICDFRARSGSERARKSPVRNHARESSTSVSALGSAAASASSKTRARSMRAGSSCQAASSPRAASSGGWAVAGLASAATKSSGTSVATARMASHSTGPAVERPWCLLKRGRDRGILDEPMTVLVTCGNGHLGANLVRRLLDEGQAVRVLVRGDSDNRALDGLDVERAWGDLRDARATREAVRGCRRVYHGAAKVSSGEGQA